MMANSNKKNLDKSQYKQLPITSSPKFMERDATQSVIQLMNQNRIGFEIKKIQKK